MANNSLSFIIPNGEIDKRLAGNSTYGKMGKHRLTLDNKALAWNLTKASLNGVAPEDFLTNYGKYPRSSAFPVTATFKRVYCAPGQSFDDDNIRPAWKAYRDGMCLALGIKDSPKFFTGHYIQEKTEGETYLMVDVTPAWALVGATQ